MRLRFYLVLAWLYFSGPYVAQVAPQWVAQANLPVVLGPMAISQNGTLAAIGNRIWDLVNHVALVRGFEYGTDRGADGSADVECRRQPRILYL